MSTGVHIALVDDDPGVLASLGLYLTTKGMAVACYERAEPLLKDLSHGLPFSCIVCDVRLPGLSGLDLQRELRARGSHIPFIVITGHGDIDMAVSAVKAGAHDFLQKPLDELRLLACVESAINQSREVQSDASELNDLEARVAELSARQREVMELASQGLSNKEIAAKLSISPRTVETYRAWVMERTGARNVAELVRLAVLLEQRKKQASSRRPSLE